MWKKWKSEYFVNALYEAEYDSEVLLVGAELVVSNLIYSSCIKCPQGMAQCSVEDPAHFHHQPPVKMPLLKMLSKQSLWY